MGATANSTIDGDFRRIRLRDGGNVPATANAAGEAGEEAWDEDYYYRCVAKDTWKRVAIAW